MMLEPRRLFERQSLGLGQCQLWSGERSGYAGDQD
jgi:hypothetical protein